MKQTSLKKNNKSEILKINYPKNEHGSITPDDLDDLFHDDLFDDNLFYLF